MNTKQLALATAAAGFGLFALMNVAGAQEAPTTTAPTLEAPSTTAPDNAPASPDGHDCPRKDGGGSGGGGGSTDGTAPSTGTAENVGLRF